MAGLPLDDGIVSVTAHCKDTVENDRDRDPELQPQHEGPILAWRLFALHGQPPQVEPLDQDEHQKDDDVHGRHRGRQDLAHEHHLKHVAQPGRNVELRSNEKIFDVILSVKRSFSLHQADHLLSQDRNHHHCLGSHHVDDL